MKKVIQLTELAKSTRPVEVEFPIYSRHDLDEPGTVIFMRTDADGRKFAIHRTERGKSVEIELSVDVVNFESDNVDYLLGKGEHASSKAEFDMALMRAMTFIQQINE